MRTLYNSITYITYVSTCGHSHYDENNREKRLRMAIIKGCKVPRENQMPLILTIDTGKPNKMRGGKT